MSHESGFQELDEQTVETIRIKAWGLIGNYGFTYDDFDDIQQEITLDLLTRLSEYDPDKASIRTFISRIIDYKVQQITEERSTDKERIRQASASLNDSFSESEGELTERIQSVTQNNLPWNESDAGSPAVDLSNLRVDLRRVLSTLSPQQLDICARLSRDNIADVARQMGLPRMTLYYHLKKIREHFENAGLKNIF